MESKRSMVSYSNGSGHCDFRYTNLVDLLETWTKEHPEEVAHIFHSTFDDNLPSNRQTVTFKQLADKSILYATALLAKGIKSGDRVAIIGSNCPEWLYLDYALLRINALLVRLPMNFIYPGVLAPVLKQYKCRALILQPGDNGEMLQTVDKILPGIISDRASCLSMYELDKLEFVYALRRTKDTKGLVPLDDLPGDAGLEVDVRTIQAGIDPDDAALTFPTSGSTGVPKFVLHSHFNLINNHSIALGDCMNLRDPNSIYFSDRPFSWFASFTFLPALFGIGMVHLDMSVTFSGNKTRIVYDIMNQERVTATTGLAYFLHDALELQEKHKIAPPKSLQYLLTGGERIPRELLDFCQKTFKRTNHAYGSTECFLCMHSTIQENKDATQLFKLSAFPYVEMKIVGLDNKALPISQYGTLMIRSPFILLKYLYNSDATTEAISSTGWFNTKDVCIMDGHGHVEIIGRTRDVISKGMTKIYPKTIENVLYQHKNIEKAVVIAVPDPRMFNEVCACVIPKGDLTVEELETFCSSAFLGDATSFAPKYYLIVKEYPQTTTGKVDSKLLLEMAIKRFNIKDN